MVRCLRLGLVAVFLASIANAQVSVSGTITYIFGPEKDSGDYGSAGDAERAQRIQNGWDNIWGKGGGGGTATGIIGTKLPPTEYSLLRQALTVARIDQISTEIEDLRKAPPQTDPKLQAQRVIKERDLAGLQKYSASRDPNDLYIQWRSVDQAFLRQISDVYFLLKTSEPRTPSEKSLKSLGIESIIAADAAYAYGDTEDAELYFGFAKTASDMLLGLDPVTGTLRSVAEAFTGINIVTGEELSSFERGLAVFGVVTLGYGSKFGKGAAAIGRLAKKSPLGEAAWNAALAYAKHFQDGFGKFSTIGASTEDALQRYASVLREAADGPRRRLEKAMGADEVLLLPEPGKASVKLTQAEADAVGQAFVGPNHTVFSDSSGKPIGFREVISEDGSISEKFGRHQYRRMEKSGKMGANLEVFDTDTNRKLSNFHIEIVD